MSSFFDSASLVQIPSGVKDGVLYSVKPIDGSGDLTFSRGSDIEATRVNANGYIEKAQVNLVLQSNTFNTTWALQNSTISGGQSGYDGTSDAWLLERLSTGAASLYQMGSFSGIYTASIYAKAGTADAIRFRVDQTTDANLYVDLTDGSIITSDGIIGSNVESIGGGWYRISMAFNAVGYVNTQVRVIDGAGAAFAGNIYIQDAQLNYGLVAQDYQETTTAAVVSGITDDMPRLSYDPANPTCPSLLLEPSRTNLIPSSEYLSFSGYTLRTISVTENYAISPEGVQNASLLTPSGSDAAILENISVTSGTTYAMSVWLKSATGSNVSTTIALGSAGFPESEGDGGKYKNITVTTEWQRFSIVSTADASVGTDISIGGFSGLATGENILAYGWQFEAGSYHTSYIPTYGSSATRTKDYIDQNLSAITSGWTEGTFFIEFVKPNTGENNDVMRLRGSGTTGRGYIYNDGFGFAANWAKSINFINGDNIKGILRLNSLSSGNVFLNGAKSADATGTAWSDIRQLRFNADGDGGVLYVKQILLFPTALTDAQCIELTQ